MARVAGLFPAHRLDGVHRRTGHARRAREDVRQARRVEGGLRLGHGASAKRGRSRRSMVLYRLAPVEYTSELGLDNRRAPTRFGRRCSMRCARSVAENSQPVFIWLAPSPPNVMIPFELRPSHPMNAFRYAIQVQYTIIHSCTYAGGVFLSSIFSPRRLTTLHVP